MNTLKRHGAATLSMLFGVASVFGLLYYMNELSKPPEPNAKNTAKTFEVEKQKKKKDRPRPKAKPKPKRAVRATRAAPMPNITTALSGMSFDLPQFQNTGLAGNTDDLLGAAGAGKRLVMTEDTVDALPKPRSRKSPEYPDRARQRGITGHVVLKLKVSERGDVEHVKVVDAQPLGVFEAVAVAAVHEWTFEPARYKGTPVAISVQQRIPFRLN